MQNFLDLDTSLFFFFIIILTASADLNKFSAMETFKTKIYTDFFLLKKKKKFTTSQKIIDISLG